MGSEIGLNLYTYLVIVNVVGFLMMGADKHRAKNHLWRIPEKTLFMVSFIGGSVGTWAGMYAFRHKTKHMQFVIGMPLIFFLQVLGASVLF